MSDIERIAVALPQSLLARDAYRRVFAAALLEPAVPTELAGLAGLEPKSVLRILETLRRAGLVEDGEQGWQVVPERVVLLVEPTPEPAAGVRAIPRKLSQRRAFLQEAADLFEPDRSYREPEVNETLKQLNPDFAALRRYLVEEGLMARADGLYRRVGPSGDMP